MTLYEPQEDSLLLQQFVETLAHGSVLDLGSGSGILAKAAAAKIEVTSVLAVDIDKHTLIHLQEQTKNLQKITVRESNLFDNIKEKFDTIIFNPPYLPQDPNDEHQALYGGKEGWELIIKFLELAKNHLNAQGIILLLFSSLTNKQRVLLSMKQEGYFFEELAIEAHFFEQLYVYKLEVKHG